MPYSIAIAGCGVAGLTAALLLAQQGHTVTLFEQSPTLGPIGNGVLLQPSGQLVLQRLGLLDQVTARAEGIDLLHAVTHHRRTLTQLPYAFVAPGMHAFGLHRHDLFQPLLTAAQNAGAKIILNTRITNCRQHPAGIDPLTDANINLGTFDLLLAADGARSLLRTASNLPAWKHDYAHGVIWATGPCHSIRNKLFQVCRGTNLLVGLLPMGEARCTVFSSQLKTKKDATRARGFPAWRNEILTLAPEAEELLTSLHSFDQTTFTTYRHIHMPVWHTGRLLLLGDAAHAMSPHLGQGINLALLDGLTIAHALAITPTPRDALILYEKLRRPHTNFYALITFLLAPVFESRGTLKGHARNLALPLLPKIPWVAPQMLLTMTGLKKSYFSGPITLPPLHGSKSVGL